MLHLSARARVTGVQNGLGTSTYTFVGQSGRVSTASFANGMQTLYDYFSATGDFMLKQIKNLSSGTTPTIISQFDYTYRQDRSIDTWKIDQGAARRRGRSATTRRSSSRPPPYAMRR